MLPNHCGVMPLSMNAVLCICTACEPFLKNEFDLTMGHTILKKIETEPVVGIDCNGRNRVERGHVHYQPGESAHNLVGRSPVWNDFAGGRLKFSFVVFLFRAGETHTLVRDRTVIRSEG